MHAWLRETLARVSIKSDPAQAIGYTLTHWKAPTRYCDDGRIEIDNNAAERALRGIGLGRRIYRFFGSDAGGKRAAAIYSLVETAKLNGLDPAAYQREVFERIADQSNFRHWPSPTHLQRPTLFRPDARRGHRRSRRRSSPLTEPSCR